MWSVVAIVVNVALWFDPSIHSRIVRGNVSDEAAAIWRSYGVDLEWGDASHADLCLTALIDRSQAATSVKKGTILGSAYVPEDVARGIAPIRIGFDAVDGLAQPSASSNAMLHEYAVSTAIGRILAHEIGHILLGRPSYHDGTGLMRPAFSSREFSLSDRWRFQLEGRSVKRLHERLPLLTHLLAACPVS